MKLNYARKTLRNLSQEQVARIIGVSLRGYQRIERGEVRPAIDTALHICEVLQVQPWAIDEWKLEGREWQVQ